MRRQPLLLLVEDDPELSELYGIALRFARFDVHPCSDGLNALEYLDQHDPDVIVLDLNLPRVSGVDIYKELRAHEATKDVPIVVCTGLDAVPDLPGAIVLRKPCSVDVVVATVQRVLRPRQRAWLYVRGAQSVRIVCDGDGPRPARLIVFGPGDAQAVFDGAEPNRLDQRRLAIERALRAEGYRGVPLFFAERRNGDERRSGRRGRSPDRRRPRERVG